MAKNELKTIQNWGRWCECHNGTPPIVDLTGYICPKCGKTVCVNCIYKTDKGVLCADCVKKVKPKSVFSLAAQDNPKLVRVIKPTIILLFIGYVFLAAVVALNIPMENGIFLIPFVLIGAGLLVYLGGLILSGLKKKAGDADLPSKKMDKLDKKIKSTKDD